MGVREIRSGLWGAMLAGLALAAQTTEYLKPKLHRRRQDYAGRVRNKVKIFRRNRTRNTIARKSRAFNRKRS